MTILSGREQADVPVVWIVGAGGQLGTALGVTAPEQVPVRLLTSADIDVTDAGSVAAALSDLGADDIVINAAAYTDVDGAEAEPDVAAAVNAEGPRLLAQSTAAASAWLVHVSTDYVFGGRPAGSAGAGLPTREQPYEPGDEAAGPAATGDEGGVLRRSVYGQSKLDGERLVHATDPTATIVRTAWVYTGAPGSPDFVGTMRRLERERDSIMVVDDQIGSPTYCLDLAAGIWELVGGRRRPAVSGAIVHATNAGAASWCEVARAVFVGVGADPERVRPCTTDEFARVAQRPAYSVLSGRSWQAAGLTPLRHWRAALHAALTADDR